MLNPLHRVKEGDRPLVRDGGGVHGAGAGADGQTRLRTEIRLVGTWVTPSSSLTPGQCGTDLWACHRDCWHTPGATSRPASHSSLRWQWAPPGTWSAGRSGSHGDRTGCRGRGSPPPWLVPVAIIRMIIFWHLLKIEVCSVMENIFIMIPAFGHSSSGCVRKFSPSSNLNSLFIHNVWIHFKITHNAMISVWTLHLMLHAHAKAAPRQAPSNLLRPIPQTFKTRTGAH